MTASDYRLVLGSRSPRRLELLRQIHPGHLIEVVPPSTRDEASFSDRHDWPSIERRLREIAQTKCDDVVAQIRSRPDQSGPPRESSPLSPRGLRRAQSSRRGAGGEGAHGDLAPVVIAADTVVIVDRAGSLFVLGQPPNDDSWQETVRRWFREDYAGKTHVVATALVVEHVDTGKRASRLVTSRVTFVDNVDRWLEWYLATGEPRGKAGGYALQGAGSVFISKVEGSLSNVVGLPLAELLELLAEL
jgi:septum formation protein